MGKRTGHREPGNGNAGPGAYRTGAAGHEEKENGTADHIERVVRGLWLDTRGVGVVEGVAVGLGWTRCGWWAECHAGYRDARHGGALQQCQTHVRLDGR
jgi:hypothetical protein